MLHPYLLLTALCLLGCAAAHAEPNADPARDAAELSQASALRDSARAELEQIERDRLSAQHDCRARVLVNRCLRQYEEGFIARERAAQAKQVAAGELERAVRARLVAAREAQRTEAGAPKPQAVLEDRSAQQQSERAAHDKAIAAGPAKAQQALQQRQALEARKAAQRESAAAAAAQRAQQAQQDRARYEAKQRKREAQRAAQAPASAAQANPLTGAGGKREQDF